MLTCTGKQSRDSMESVLKKNRKGYGRKDLQKKEGCKPGMKEWGGDGILINNMYKCLQRYDHIEFYS